MPFMLSELKIIAHCGRISWGVNHIGAGPANRWSKPPGNLHVHPIQHFLKLVHVGRCGHGSRRVRNGLVIYNPILDFADERTPAE